jgi:hypothetical protein
MNKRERYTKEHMPEHVMILYNRFMDKNFVNKLIQNMVIDEEEENENNFNIHQFRMFKVGFERENCKSFFFFCFSRVFLEILAWI